MSIIQTGLDLDRAVAEQFSGIKPREVRVKGSTNTVTIWDDNPALSDGLWTKEELERYGRPPEYSTDGNAMLTLLSELSMRGWCYLIESGVHDKDHDIRCSLTFSDGGQCRIVEDTGNTAQEAVARASLQAIQLPKPNKTRR